MKFVVFVTLVLGLLDLSLGQVNWCSVQQSYCGGSEHIACLPNSFPTTSCSNLVSVPITQAMKDYIVQKHNQYRQQIASGSNSRFPSASRMGQMHWDDTLQYLAQMHVNHCTFEHDECRATPEFPWSGQNLYMSSTTAPNPDVTQAFGAAADSWFDEYRTASLTLVDSFQYSDLNAGHFSVMVKDINTRIGCGAITYSSVSGGTNWNSVQITCNYQDTNMLNDPTYARGTGCSNCSAGCSTTYNALCNT